MANNNYLGNGTTIGKFILIMIAGRALTMATAYGINLPINDIELAGYIGIILGFIYSIIDSYFKNNLKWTHLKKIISKISNTEIPEETEDETSNNDNVEDVDLATEEELIEEDVAGDFDDDC